MIARWFAATLFCVLAISIGCDRARSSAQVHKDVSEAQQKADEKVADANREVAMARIDGEYEVAKKRCEALTSDAQAACRDNAKAEYEMAKQRVDGTFKN